MLDHLLLDFPKRIFLMDSTGRFVHGIFKKGNFDSLCEYILCSKNSEKYRKETKIPK
jgi:hypothetical protein